jgi:16S rRNA processing protein RimM
MIRKEEVFRIGRLGKAHGIQGEVTLQFDDDSFDRVDADFLVLEVEGILVPFFMEEYRFRSDSTALVKFCDVDTQERARELTGCDVYFPHRLADHSEEDLSWAAIIGFHIVDNGTQQTIGAITEVDDSTENVLFVVDAHHEELLIPASEELITGVDYDSRTIQMNIPEGLI